MAIVSPRLSNGQGDACGRSMTPPPGLKLPQGITLPVGFKPPPGLTSDLAAFTSVSGPIARKTSEDTSIVTNADFGETSAGSTASDGTASESDESFGGSPRSPCRTTVPRYKSNIPMLGKRPVTITVSKGNTHAADNSPPLTGTSPHRTALRSEAVPFHSKLPFVPMAEVKAAWQRWHAKNSYSTEGAWAQRT